MHALCKGYTDLSEPLMFSSLSFDAVLCEVLDGLIPGPSSTYCDRLGKGADEERRDLQVDARHGWRRRGGISALTMKAQKLEIRRVEASELGRMSKLPARA
jgi:hypothetical protein